ncbi:MAG: hypothetical protein ACRC6T_13250 [Sarcina sp.]
MKIIYQEKNNPTSIGEFEILDREQIDKLSKYTDNFLETSDKDFKIPNRIDDEDDEKKNKKHNYKPIPQKYNSPNPSYSQKYQKPYKEKNYYNQEGIPTPYNIGYPPSKNPTYNSQGIVKMPCYNTNEHSNYHYDHCKKLKLCTYRHTYLLLRNGESFWCYPTYIGLTTISGWKWNNYKWKFFSIPIKRVSNFYCYR